MEIRKVQLTGGSSYVVTLPKDWINARKIQKNDPVGLMIQHDGTLLITSRTDEEPTLRTREISLDNIDTGDVSYIHRLLVSAYVAGYNQIILSSQKRIDPSTRESVIEFIQDVIGPEVIDEDTNTMTIKDLLSPTEMPFKNTMKRMHMLVKAMHHDAVQALLDGDRKKAEGVADRDRDVDKLNWLIHRQYSLITADMNLSKKMEVSRDEALFFFIAGRLMERIGDHAVMIARNSLLVDRKKMGAKVLETVASASTASLDIVTGAMEAWMKSDSLRAHRSIEAFQELAKKCDAISDAAMEKGGANSVALSQIAESIRRTGMYGTDIAEMTMNVLVTR